MRIGKSYGLLAFGLGDLLLSCQPETKNEVESPPVKKVEIAEIEAGIKQFIAAKTKENGGAVKDENHDPILGVVYCLSALRFRRRWV